MSHPITLRDVPAGHYRFLPGIAPFSSGVVARPGHQVVHATLRAPIPWRDGFALIDRHLGAEGRPRAALCAIELRSPGSPAARPSPASSTRWTCAASCASSRGDALPAVPGL